jgi:CBS domain-containing protein
MRDRDIGSVLVVNNGKLEGIVTEPLGEFP